MTCSLSSREYINKTSAKIKCSKSLPRLSTQTQTLERSNLIAYEQAWACKGWSNQSLVIPDSNLNWPKTTPNHSREGLQHQILGLRWKRSSWRLVRIYKIKWIWKEFKTCSQKAGITKGVVTWRNNTKPLMMDRCRKVTNSKGNFHHIL